MKKFTSHIGLLLATVMLCTALCSCDLLDALILEPDVVNETSGTYITPDGTSDSTSDSTVIEIDPDEPHKCVFGEWQHDENIHYTECRLCGKRNSEGEHSLVTTKGYAPTCNEDGYTDVTECEICKRVTALGEVIPATGKHNLVACGVVAPTFDTDGCSSGKQCTLCQTVFDGVGVFPAAKNTRGDYAYTALASKANGASMQRFYNKLYEECVSFHTNSNTDASYNENEKLYIAFTVNFAECGVTSADDAFSILHSLQADCPLFYWISNSALTTDTTLYVCADPDYVKGSERAKYNSTIYSGLADVEIPTGSAYERVFFLHDYIIDTMDYARKSDGITAEDAPWAHNIEGFFTRQLGVCETYAETCELFLNYWNIENIMVTGEAEGVGHAWSLIQMDDGKWYWFDLTWDDQPSFPYGRIYDYFCKIDSNFDSRTIDTTLYTLPERATADFVPTTPTVGQQFTVDGLSFTVEGFSQVQITKATASATTLPSTLMIQGRSYTVVGMGCVIGNTAYRVLQSSVRTIVIPATIKFIQQYSFSGCYGVSIEFEGTQAEWQALSAKVEIPDSCTVTCKG